MEARNPSSPTREDTSLLRGERSIKWHKRRDCPSISTSHSGRRHFSMFLSSTLLLLGGLYVLALPQQANSVVGPVIGSNFQDPSVVQLEDGSWIAYAGINGNPENTHVLIATSPDFSSWTVRWGHDALPALPSWAAIPPRVWAPDVTQLDNGHFVLYYSVAMAESPAKHCVAAATAPNAEGPFTPVETPLFCDLDAGGAIDADGFNDPTTHRQYVVYKVDGNSVGHGGECMNSVAPIAPTPLVLQEVSADDGYSFIGQPTAILLNDSEDGPNIEAPTLLYDPSSETYVLFYSSRCFTTQPYNIRYATSKSVYGPYTKQSTPFLRTGDTAANLFVPGGIDVSKDGQHAVLHGDTNMGWFQGDGSKRVRAMYAVSLGFANGAVSLRSFH